jgi:aldose 1-epimerase
VARPRRQDPRAAQRFALDLDHCFEGWNGRASVTWPEERLELALEADPVFSHAVIYAPPQRPFFCFEPVSHANFALNLAEQGVDGVGFRSLEPGETLRGEVCFSVRDRG